MFCTCLAGSCVQWNMETVGALSLGVNAITRTVLSCFVIKQKTAYEVRISDWSSDVCASDLTAHRPKPLPQVRRVRSFASQPWRQRSEERRVGQECVSPCRSRWSPHHYKTYNYCTTA